MADEKRKPGRPPTPPGPYIIETKVSPNRWIQGPPYTYETILLARGALSRLESPGSHYRIVVQSTGQVVK